MQGRQQPIWRASRLLNGCWTIVRSFDNIRNMEEQHVIASLTALAQPMRLRIFRALIVAGREGLTPGALAEQFAVAASTLSFHLKELTHAQLASQERDGRNLIYRARYDHMNALLGYLTEHCCQGEPCLAPHDGQACAPESALLNKPSCATC